MMGGVDHEIVIIGAGFSGIGAGIALKRAGFDDFVILERDDDIGGTWHQNRYPDIGVDVPSFSYQFSFEKNPYWSRVFAKGDEVKRYVDHCTDKYGVRPHLRLSTEVRRREWDGESRTWRLTLADGAELVARYVISAVGAFVEPKELDIPGVEDFEGTLIRSQAWDDDVELEGKRVAVIGTGASAVQLIPPVGRAASQMYVFQRRPIWLSAKPDWKIPASTQWVLAHVPGAASAAHLFSSALVEWGIVGTVVFGRRFPPLVDVPERVCRAWMHSQVKDPELRRKLTPDYGFGCKRPSMSNTYYRTFTKPHVELVTDRIETVTATGIRTEDGVEREIDVLILATGFRLSTDPEVFRRTPVIGRDGFDLAEAMAAAPLRTYEGVSLDGLPNTFTIFGPFSWTGASWHTLVETQAHHVIRVLNEARRREARWSRCGRRRSSASCASYAGGPSRPCR
jgi:cation diffusion facilitator CzcD-associated flavoprotein CzcO